MSSTSEEQLETALRHLKEYARTKGMTVSRLEVLGLSHCEEGKVLRDLHLVKHPESTRFR